MTATPRGDADETRGRVLHALPAGRARDLALLEHVVAGQQVPALHEQVLVERPDHEQVLGTRRHAVAARGALTRDPPPAARRRSS